LLVNDLKRRPLARVISSAVASVKVDSIVARISFTDYNEGGKTELVATADYGRQLVLQAATLIRPGTETRTNPGGGVVL
jgi:hypothetical protein